VVHTFVSHRAETILVPPSTLLPAVAGGPTAFSRSLHHESVALQAQGRQVEAVVVRELLTKFIDLASFRQQPLPGLLVCAIDPVPELHSFCLSEG
jgi:hypothetical protein